MDEENIGYANRSPPCLPSLPSSALAPAPPATRPLLLLLAPRALNGRPSARAPSPHRLLPQVPRVSPRRPLSLPCSLGAADFPSARRLLAQRRSRSLPFSLGLCRSLPWCGGSLLPCRWWPFSSVWLGPSPRVPTPARLNSSHGGAPGEAARIPDAALAALLVPEMSRSASLRRSGAIDR